MQFKNIIRSIIRKSSKSLIAVSLLATCSLGLSGSAWAGYGEADQYFRSAIESFDQEGYSLHSCTFKFQDDGSFGHDQETAATLKGRLIENFQNAMTKLQWHQMYQSQIPDYFAHLVRSTAKSPDFSCSGPASRGIDHVQGLVDDLNPIFSIALLKYLISPQEEAPPNVPAQTISNIFRADSDGKLRSASRAVRNVKP